MKFSLPQRFSGNAGWAFWQGRRGEPSSLPDSGGLQAHFSVAGRSPCSRCGRMERFGCSDP